MTCSGQRYLQHSTNLSISSIEGHTKCWVERSKAQRGATLTFPSQEKPSLTIAYDHFWTYVQIIPNIHTYRYVCIYNIYIYVYMYVYIYKSMYIYIHIHVYTCIYIHIHMYMSYIYMYIISVYVYMSICIYVYMYICIYVYMYIWIYVYIYVYIYTWIYGSMDICIYVYRYICIYVYMYICNVMQCTAMECYAMQCNVFNVCIDSDQGNPGEQHPSTSRILWLTSFGRSCFAILINILTGTLTKQL